MHSYTEANSVYETELIGKISWRLLPFMLVLYVISYLDRINVSFAALEMNRDLGLSDAAFGLGAGIFFIGYCLFGIPSNIIIERLGARRWIAGIMIVWGILTVMFCLIKTPAQFYGLRLLLGIAEAGFFPGMLLYLTYWFPGKYYGTAVARFMTAIPVSGIIGSAVAAAALSMTGYQGIAGWMWLFIVTGIPAVIFGILVLVFLPDNPKEAGWLTSEEADIIETVVKQKNLPPDKQVSESTNVSRDKQVSAKTKFIGSIKNPRVWRFACLYFTLTLSMYGFQLWLPQIIKSFEDISDTQTAMLAAIPAVFQALGMLIIAGRSDKTGERQMHVVTAAAITCTGLLLALAGQIVYLQLAGLCLAAFGIWGSVGPFWALARENLQEKDHATGIAVINSVGNLGGFAGPYLVGLVKHGTQGFGSALIVLALSSVCAAALAATSKSKEEPTT